MESNEEHSIFSVETALNAAGIIHLTTVWIKRCIVLSIPLHLILLGSGLYKAAKYFNYYLQYNKTDYLFWAVAGFTYSLLIAVAAGGTFYNYWMFRKEILTVESTAGKNSFAHAFALMNGSLRFNFFGIVIELLYLLLILGANAVK